MNEERLPAVVEELRLALNELRVAQSALLSVLGPKAAINKPIDVARGRIATQIGVIIALADMLRHEGGEAARIGNCLAPEQKEEAQSVPTT